MVFSSILFVFQFLPAALLLYYITPRVLKNFILLLASFIFYSWGEFRYFPVMLALILINYVSALLIDRFERVKTLKKCLMIFAVSASLGMLFFFKYLDFVIVNLNAAFSLSISTLNLTLPLGISFYTFQTLSYTLDVYWGRTPAQKNPVTLGTFVVMFPQLIAGPIVRYTDVSAELKSRSLTPEALESGMEDFIIGLAKKALIANNVGQLWDEVMDIGVGALSTPLAWLGILAFALQIYFDFSGYSQMAIGMGKMLGFKFPKNFDNPYVSRSVTEFWRRWHMTLGSWFREYLYFPLGGSRRGKARTYLNLFIVWSLTGLWHGASWNFFWWGIYFCLLLFIEKAGFISFLNKSRVVSHIYMMLVLLVGWALFAITDFHALTEFLRRMFWPTAFTSGSTVGAVYYLRNYAVILLVGCFFSSSLPTRIYTRIRKNRGVRILLMGLLLLFSAAYLADSTYNPFFYFRF